MKKQNQVAYELDYALRCLRDAIDYAETDHDFQPARKWVNEVELSAAQAGLAGEEMLSAKEWLGKKYPEYEIERGVTGHDNVYQEINMQEYALYFAAKTSVKPMACLHENTARVTGIRLHCVDCGEDF